MAKCRTEDKKNALLPECVSNVVSKNEIKYPPNSDSVAQNNQNVNPETKDKRCRWWALEVYPESASENWQQLLNGYKWAMSPLHDKDTNDDGTPKKAHWHLAVYFPNKAYYHEVVELAFALSKMKHVQPIKNLQGMIRYFAHLDNAEKYHYDPKDIKGFGGFDVAKYLQTSTDIDELMREIETYIRQNYVTEYADLVDLSSDLHDEHPEWHKCITTHTIHFKAYISSKRHAPPKAPAESQEQISDLVDQALKTEN